MKYDFDLDLDSKNSLSIIISRIKKDSRVLEFGPASGRMTKYLKEELDCDVFCVEIDQKNKKSLNKYAKKIVIDDIEKYNWKKDFSNVKFDYIIFADVLEHLLNPKRALEECKKFLKEEGSIFVSIPNISHNSIIINLMMNKFEYKQTGILDKTHLHFFTKNSFDKILESLNLYNHFFDTIDLTPLKTEFNNSYLLLPKKIAKFLKRLPYGEVYQLIYELKNFPKESKRITSEKDKEKSYFDRNEFKDFLFTSSQIQKENSLLWRRISEAENKLSTFNDENSKLWTRVHQAESKNKEYEKRIFDLEKKIGMHKKSIVKNIFNRILKK